MSLEAQARAALGTVYDPELDEPITTLGFVSSLEVDGGRVSARLCLPTPQCAPNFAFLMAADAREALREVPGITEVDVVLEDHYTGAEINSALASGGGFDAAFPGESSGDLSQLRELFLRKALVARQGRICTALARDGLDADAILALRLDELPVSPDAVRCVQLRRTLGLPHDPGAAAIVAGDGSAVGTADYPGWVRRARLIALSLESNGGLCRSLLRVRHGVHDPTEDQEVFA